MRYTSAQELDQQIQQLRRISDMIEQLIAELKRLSIQNEDSELAFLKIYSLRSIQMIGMYKDHLQEVEELIGMLEQLKASREEMYMAAENASFSVMERPVRPREPASPAAAGAAIPRPTADVVPHKPAASAAPPRPAASAAPLEPVASAEPPELDDDEEMPEPASAAPPEPAASGESYGFPAPVPPVFRPGAVVGPAVPAAKKKSAAGVFSRVKDLFGAKPKREAAQPHEVGMAPGVGAFGDEKRMEFIPLGDEGQMDALSFDAGEQTKARPSDAAPPDMSRVQFSAVAPKRLMPGEYGIVDVVMYEQQFRHVVDELLRQAEQPMREARSGVLKVAVGSQITVRLTSPDVTVDEPEQTMTWQGDYLDFGFAVTLPEGFGKRQALFTAGVYLDGVVAVKLRFVMECGLPRPQRAEVIRQNIMSAFVSYASEDRGRVATVIQGMKKIRPELDVFFDVNSLRSGEDWAQSILEQIEKRDVLFLCWSHFASASPWVEKEWRYALEHKGIEGIEPIPFESPSACPPPAELRAKHFNDQLLYIINAK